MARSSCPRAVAATSVVLSALLAGPGTAAALRPADGPYVSRAAGLPRPAVEFVVRGGRIPRPARGPALMVTGIRCTRGQTWLTSVRVGRGRLSGRLRTGMFTGGGRWVRGDAFDITGRWTAPRLVTGRMRYRRTAGRRCDSGWVRWRAAIRDPVSVTSSAPLTFAVPGDLDVSATVTNAGDLASPRTAVRLGLTGLASDTPENLRPQVAAITATQGTCDPAFVPDEFGIQSFVTCRLGVLAPHTRATATATLRWSSAACFDPQTGWETKPPEVVRQVFVDSPLNDTRWARDPDEDSTQPSDSTACPPSVPSSFPPPPPPPVDEPG